nr:protein terminal ear1-like [Tanacetum cinerariifolium]
MSVSTRASLRDVYRSLFSARCERRRKLLVKFLEDHCKTQNEMVGNDDKSAFDFVYLPIDIKLTYRQISLLMLLTHTMILLTTNLAESDNEDLINVDDDGVDKMSADVARSHGGDGGGEDRPLHTMYPAVTCVALLTEAKANESPISVARQRGRAAHGIPRLDRDQCEHLAALAKGTSTTQEYLWLIDTFFMAHTVNGEFLRDEDRRIFEDIRRLEAMGTYTDDEISRLARGGSSEGILPAWFKSGGASGSGGCRDEEEGADHQDDKDEDGDGDT